MINVALDLNTMGRVQSTNTVIRYYRSPTYVMEVQVSQSHVDPTG
jgi:hypothetical protein